MIARRRNDLAYGLRGWLFLVVLAHRVAPATVSAGAAERYGVEIAVKEQLQNLYAKLSANQRYGLIGITREEWATMLRVLEDAACSCEPCEACTEDQAEACFVCGGTRKQSICPICAPGYDHE